MKSNQYLLLFTCLLLCFGTACKHNNKVHNQENTSANSVQYILDMVHNNPGEGETNSVYNNPEFVKNRGYNGMVPQWFVNCAISYDNFEKDIIPKSSDELKWIEERAAMIDNKLQVCDDNGMNAYAFTDIFVAPQSIWNKYGNEMGMQETNFSGYGGDVKNVRKPNIQTPLIQKLMKAQMDGIFERFPSLDGLVIRFGETYLHDTPYHMGGKLVRQGNEGIEDHVKLINLLREEVCVKLNKKLFYRTWDFGWLHTNPEIYLAITNQIEPHPNLVFSIKHTKGDFHRKFPFNPTLGIGKHKQIVEVQCQREYEGKGAHPNYVANAVINGFEEYEGMSGMKCLNDFKSNPNFCGIWTWSRGGGWKGPYISNELWCDLNAFVVSEWAQDTSLLETDIFNKYCQQLGLTEKDTKTFRELALLSNRGVFYGRTSKVANINTLWIRDQFMGGITAPEFNSHTKEAWGKLNKDFKVIVDKNLVDAVLEEKAMAVGIWNEIERLSKSITSGDDKFKDYLRVSSSYGRIKYEIIQQAWIIMLKAMESEKTRIYEKAAILDAKVKYDQLWNDFKYLKANNQQCATLYQPYSFDLNYETFHGEEGMDKAVNGFVAYIKDK
jgi:hypothetical protein